MNSFPIISRLAPTPSGYLHRGNALNFILTWVMTRAGEGTLHLRIDDYDKPRCKEIYVENIFEVLEWLKLDWDKGPFDVTTFNKEYCLETKIDYYREEIKAFHSSSSLTYACECSRKEIDQASMNGLYPFTCKDKGLALQEKQTALRLHVKSDTNITIEDTSLALDKVLGDFVVWRKEDLPSYQFASLLADRDMKTSLLVRGKDLLESSAAQKYLALELGIQSFQEATFYHHPLLLDHLGNKLSKTHHAQKLDISSSPLSLYQDAAMLLGLKEKVENLQDLLNAYKDSFIKGAGSAK